VGRPISSLLALVNSQSGHSINALVGHVLAGTAPATAWKADVVTNTAGQIPVELVASPMALDGAGAAGVILTLRDRTDEQHTERQVQRLLETAHSEREWFSLVLNSIADEVYFTDTDQRYTYANPAAMREFGHESVQGIEVAKVIENLVVLRPDGSPRPISDAPPLRALRGEVIRDEEQIVHTPRTGELRHRQVSAAPVHDRHGRIIGSVSVVRDITERRRDEPEPPGAPAPND
jgi:PAS domain S-box-containing protein